MPPLSRIAMVRIAVIPGSGVRQVLEQQVALDQQGITGQQSCCSDCHRQSLRGLVPMSNGAKCDSAESGWTGLQSASLPDSRMADDSNVPGKNRKYSCPYG
jgi:hypothetical protein